MTENTPEQPAHQDPAAPYQDDTQTETAPQEEPQAVVPVEPDPVVVEPAPPVAGKADRVFDKDYTVTPEAGYRRV